MDREIERKMLTGPLKAITSLVELGAARAVAVVLVDGDGASSSWLLAPQNFEDRQKMLGEIEMLRPEIQGVFKSRFEKVAKLMAAAQPAA